MSPEPPRWTDLTGAAKGSTYDDRWAALPEDRRHGEADLVEDLLTESDSVWGPPETILDAGCGTGRVAIELADRGFEVLGVDRDPDLLATARAKAPALPWFQTDLVDVGQVVNPRSVHLAVLAGNVLIFTEPGTERAVLAGVAGTVRPGGLLVAGFSIRPGGYDTEQLDADADAVGLTLRDRWSTWDRQPWSDGDYQVSVHVVGADPVG